MPLLSSQMAPMTALFLDIAILYQNQSSSYPYTGVSFCTYSHVPLSHLNKTYIDPLLYPMSSSQGYLIMVLSPDRSTSFPNQSSLSTLMGTVLDSSYHNPFSLWKMYSNPLLTPFSSLTWTPMKALSPDRATEFPKQYTERFPFLVISPIPSSHNPFPSRTNAYPPPPLNHPCKENQLAVYLR